MSLQQCATLLLLSLAPCLKGNNGTWGVLAFASVPQKSTTTTTVSIPVVIENTDDIINNHVVIPEHHQDDSTSALVALPIWKMALAGCLATMVGDAAMHPLDCIKTLQQSDQGVGLSFLGSVGYLWHQYGLVGFYHGLGTYAASDGGGGALKFATYETLKKQVQQRVSPNQEGLANFVCAAIAFVVSSSVIVPGELLKQQLQMSHYDTLLEAMSAIFQQDGLGGFFCGYEGVCLRDVPYTMIELGLYDLLKRKALETRNDDDDQQSTTLEPWQEIAAAAVTGGVAAFVTTPLDTIKTKVMVDSYGSFMDCFVTTVQLHGPLSVFAGAGARVAWLIPFTALYLPIYDYIKRQMMNKQESALTVNGTPVINKINDDSEI